jgi:hypothetical protein
LIRRHGVVIGSFWIVLTATAATAQRHEATALEQSTTVTRDINGNDKPTERVVTHRSQTDDREEVVIETYTRSMEWGRFALSRRVRRVTTVTSDGSRTVEETEALSHAEPSRGLRLVQRIVTTVRRFDADSYVSESEVFDLDLNGRLVLSSHTKYASGR